MNGRAVLSAALIWFATAGVSAAAEPGQGDAAEAGRRAFAVCGACHTATAGGAALIGPNLWGVVGRPVASVRDFDYSADFEALGGTWTPERLDRFLTNPMAFAPGTRMGYAGVADPVERAALVAYLATLQDGGPSAVAAAAQPDFGPDWPAGPGQAEAGVLCNVCHSLAIVKQQRLTRDVWDGLLDWMVEEQGMPEQTPERRLLILEYLATHFGPP
jgi:cytochrome c